MNTLHISLDHNFVSNSRKIFEEYYPGDNMFIVHSTSLELKMIKSSDGFTVMNLYEQENIERVVRICRENGVKRVMLHALMKFVPRLLESIKKEMDVRVYWIFWGYELYETLAFEKGYKITDHRPSFLDKERYLLPGRMGKLLRKLTDNYRPDAFIKSFPSIDYFCFWNKSDYDLWKQYFDVKAEFKFFAYGANHKGDEPRGLFATLEQRPTRNIMINHQASMFGNYQTVFERLGKLDPQNEMNKIVPLSYGSDTVRRNVMRRGRSMFGDKFKPVLDFMKFDDYCRMLSSVDVAIFGQHRQEASGNIIELLKNGVKIFLRDDNNLLDYYRKKGYIIFSFDTDLTGKDSLKGLTKEQKEHNRQCYIENRLYYEDFMPGLYDGE